MSQFYITLPSDSSVKYFPNNTVAHYTTKLPESLNLNGDYEVGLSEIIYTKSWHNYPPEDCYLNLTKAAVHYTVIARSDVTFNGDKTKTFLSLLTNCL
jgi:hypothetical protein